MTGFRALSLLALVNLLSATVFFCADVLTNYYDSFRSAANRDESTINTANVAVQTFGRTHHFAVDGPVYAFLLQIAAIISFRIIRL